MEFATPKDLMRADSLGKHSGAVNSSQLEIARGKASTMALAITDKNKILGRLEAISAKWRDYHVLEPFIDKCIQLWPNNQYEIARREGKLVGKYLRSMSWDINPCINVNDLRKMGILMLPEGKFITGKPYTFNSVGLIIYNIEFERGF